jgi:hypothetical protein
VRGLIVTLEPILQQKVDYEPYSTCRSKLVWIIHIHKIAEHIQFVNAQCIYHTHVLTRKSKEEAIA